MNKTSRYNLKTLFILSLILLIPYNVVKAQLIVDTGMTADSLAQLLVGEGIEVSNATLDCKDLQYGTFNGENTNLGVNEGIILTSGKATIAIGPNNQGGAGESLGETSGDPELEALIPGFSINDHCVLEFDFEPFGENLSFSYVFGSEEYLEFVNSSFNDVFGFFITGPGFPSATNIAFIPGTTDIPVSINNVNDQSFPEFYINNGTGADPDPESTIQYDGFTTILAAKATVTPCETYHLKLAIADAGDGVLDSGVFLEAGSLNTNFVEIDAQIKTTLATGENVAIEGCSDILVTLTTTNTAEDDIDIVFEVGGTAVPGEDYEEFSTAVTIPAGELSTEFNIKTLEDFITEIDNDTITLTYTIDFCGANKSVQVIHIPIKDIPPLTISEDQYIEMGEAASLEVGGGSGFYTWEGYGIGDPNSPEQFVFPFETTTYCAKSEIGDCVYEECMTVYVISEECNPDDGPYASDITTNNSLICFGDDLNAFSDGAITLFGDVVGYMLHNNPDGDANAAGFTQHAFNTTGVFTNDGSYPYNTELYVTYFVADDDGSGLPDLDAAVVCVSTTESVVFLKQLEILVDESCDYTVGDFTILVSARGGYAEYDTDAAYEIMGDINDVLKLNENASMVFPENTGTSYYLKIVNDAAGVDDPVCAPYDKTTEYQCEKNPIELIEFKVTAEENGNLVEWTTASEIDNDYFTIERRSAADQPFETITIIDGAGNSNSPIHYDYLDPETGCGTVYYRLTWVDYNGIVEYSNVITITRNDNPLKDILIAPVPAKDNIDISFNLEGIAGTLSIYDLSGKMVHRQSVESKGSCQSSNVNLNISDLSSGMYFVHIDNANAERMKSSKFIKE